MSESRLISIHNETDIIDARMQTRQMAIDAGLPIMDQARISLAVSSLAHIIRLGDGYPGQIILNQVDEPDRCSVQVTCKMAYRSDIESVLQELKNSPLKAMVHELDVQDCPESGICITAWMWKV